MGARPLGDARAAVRSMHKCKGRLRQALHCADAQSVARRPARKVIIAREATKVSGHLTLGGLGGLAVSEGPAHLERPRRRCDLSSTADGRADRELGLFQKAGEDLLFAPARKEGDDHHLGRVLDAANLALAEARVANARPSVKALESGVGGVV